MLKQTRFPFPVCQTSTTSYFELIHVFVWGKYSTATRNGHHYFLTLTDDFF